MLFRSISLKQSKISEEESEVNVKMARGDLFPSLSFSTSQNLSYRPFQESSSNLVNDGVATSSSHKVTENGSYNLGANWTVWNGGKNTKTLKSRHIASEAAELNTAASANSIQEQIAQLYVQILYLSEAVKVNESTLATSIAQRDRGVVRVEVGDLSLSDLAQLEAQVTQDEYNVVNARTQVASYTLQLKQLLEIDNTAPFEIAYTVLGDEVAYSLIPNQEVVYDAALLYRPEIRAQELDVTSSDLNVSIARAGYFPTIGLSAGINTSHMSGSHTNVGEQAKRNLNGSVGLNVSVPIYDNYTNKGSVSKAKLTLQNSQLELVQKKKQLFSSIETLWLDATSSQQRFAAAQKNVSSTELSYELTNEQFALGLKNIVELMTSKDNLLTAQQEIGRAHV